MKTKSVINALNKIMVGTEDGNKTVFVNNNRTVEVIDQNGNAVCLLILNGEVVHNGNHTIKNIIAFITNDLTEDQINYLKTVRSIFSKSTNESRIEIAKVYQTLKVILSKARGESQ